MRAMIFCAGLGTRLRPLTDTIPKALVSINGKTLLQYQIERLCEAGIKDIVVNVHHFPDLIIDYIAKNDAFGCNIQVSDERDMLLDTGGGLLNATSLLGNDNVLACNVDILSNININAFIHTYNGELASLVVSDRKTQRYLLFDEEHRMQGWTNITTGEVRGEYKEHFTHLAFSGMQILSSEIYPLAKQYSQHHGRKFSLIDLYLSLCKEHSIKAYIPDNYRMTDVGKPKSLAEAEQFMSALNTYN